TSGWVVALNHGITGDVNNVHSILWELPDSMAPGQILYRNDANWGSDIIWASSGPNWAMILDDDGNIVDFIPWKFSIDDLAALNVTINGFPITVGDAWSGASFNPLGISSGSSFQRRGFSDGNTAADWAIAPETMGTRNADLTTPFTAVGLELTSSRMTTYFRTEFDFSDVPSLSELALDLIIDDGAVFYLNGTEIYRHNMPQGTVTYSTPASTNVLNPAFIYGIEVPSDSLVQGRNVMAVEVHQATSDMGYGLFGMGITATVWPPDWRLVDVALALNETAGADQGEFWLELANFSTKAVQLGGHVIANAAGSQYVLPSQTLATGGFMTVSRSQLGFEVDSGDELFLYAPGRAAVLDGVQVKSTLRGRSPDGSGPWMRPVDNEGADAPTPGQANVFAFHDEIVINEIMYHAFPQLATDTQPFAESDEEWIELYNRGSTTVDLSDWRLEDAAEYDFPAGTTLAPGGYLVVARDAVTLRAKYPAIAGRIVGDFSGTLGNKDERIALIDDHGNPADEVHYYERDPWPEYADGGGSSLELRDPDADNSKAEAWAASSEGGKSQWTTFTIRKVSSEPMQIGGTVFPEFVFGLLDAGEFLIDDVSVIRDPDGARTQMIQNGSFQAYTVGSPPTASQWRLIGTHTGTIVADPNNAANKVLYVVADGPQAFVHDHVETTLSSSIIDGREYEISFRVKWLGGNSQINNRLYFTRMGNTVQMPVPEKNGTPGARNSTFEANVGPTYSDLGHAPVLPTYAEPVTISVRAEDPEGVGSVVLNWRRDGTAWTTVAMTLDGEGYYRSTIPAQPAGTIVQFYVQGTDGLGVTSTFPAAGANSRALYKVDEGAGTSYQIDTMRIVLMSAEYSNLFVNINEMSNNYVRGTLIHEARYGDEVLYEAYHDVQIRQVGSRFLRPNSGYKIVLPPDKLFNGVHGSIRFDLSGGGPREIYMKHMVNRAGGSSVSLYDDIAYLIHRHPSEPNRTVLFQMARYEDVFLNEQFENGSDGTLWELDDITYPTSPNAQNYKTNATSDAQDIRYRGEDPEAYRGQLLIKNNRTQDEYEKIVELARALNLSGQALYDATNEIMDVDLWMRHYATQAFLGNWDTYGFRRPKNLRIYLRPEDGKLIPLYWDADLANLSDSLIYNGSDSRLDEIRNIPQNQRLFWGHMLDLVDRAFNQQYMTYWIPHYNARGAGINYTASTIGARANSAISQARSAIPQVAFHVTTNGGNAFSVNDIGATLRGDGWIDVREIRLAGSQEPLDVTWTDNNSWELRVPLAPGANQLTFQAIDFRGNVTGSDTITITSTMVQRPLEDFLRITEIMYDPAEPTPAERAAGYTATSEFEFIELMNTSDTFTLNLAGVAFDTGIATAAGALNGKTLAPGQRTVLVRNPAAFQLRYGSQIVVAGTFTGKLDNAGEQLRLVDPFGQTILDFEYGSGGAWPGRAAGKGASLELIVDNTAPADYGDSAFWQSSVAHHGTPGAEPQDPIGIVINEVLTHTDLPQVDAIELYNPTDQAIDIAGWYLSDSWGWQWLDDPAQFYDKFRIPVLNLGGPGKTLLGPGQYICFDEYDFNVTGLDANPANDDPHDFGLDAAEG
ncbi:MAG TPA: lamin tail domain-containing protein, partial [Thermoguttaceae bacterium]|nr:lamin tail domain-containing protein [Thermoguttaceae bacterium]